MADEKIVIKPSDVDSIISEYATARTGDIAVEFSGVNNLDVLFLLDIMNKKQPSATDLAPAAEAMLDGRVITFTQGGKEIKTLAYNRGSGNSLHMMFADEPYLYDILQQTCYALMLKKLTPHLGSSN